MNEAVVLGNPGDSQNANECDEANSGKVQEVPPRVWAELVDSEGECDMAYSGQQLS